MQVRSLYIYSLARFLLYIITLFKMLPCFLKFLIALASQISKYNKLEGFTMEELFFSADLFTFVAVL